MIGRRAQTRMLIALVVSLFVGLSGCIEDPASFEGADVGVDDTGDAQPVEDADPGDADADPKEAADASGDAGGDTDPAADCGGEFTWCDEAFDDGGCVDLSTDPMHCGECGNGCEAGDGELAVCADADCEVICDAASGFADCSGDGECIDLNVADEHCGSCGNNCEYGECVEGECVDTACDPGAEPFGGGSGSPDNPYLLCSAGQLQRIAELPDTWWSVFQLRDDLDFDDLDADFEPIPEFQGLLDGGGYAIENFAGDYYQRHVGLFSILGASGQVTNLSLESLDIHNDYDTGENDTETTGAIAGYNEGLIHELEVEGAVSGQRTVGAIVGYNSGQITAVSAEVDVDGGNWGVGGVSGANSGQISHVHQTGDEISGSSWAVGGLSGVNWGVIAGSTAEPAVDGGQRVGGLVGENTGMVVNSKATGDVDATEERVGGLVGFHHQNGSILSSHAEGDVTAPEAQRVGGVVGYLNDGETDISGSSATGDVEGGDLTGGFVGQLENGTVSQSFAAGKVQGIQNVGGFAGQFTWSPTVFDSYATGGAEGVGRIGGFVGQMYSGDLINSYAVGEVDGEWTVGGLVGEDGGYSPSVENSYWDVATTGQTGSDLGTPLDSESDDGNEFAESERFSGWNFAAGDEDGIWTMPDSDELPDDWDFVRPRLTWEFDDS